MIGQNVRWNQLRTIVTTFAALCLFGILSTDASLPNAVDDFLRIFEDAEATIIDVLGNDFHVDGDAIHVITVDTLSSNGGIVTRSGDSITYQPFPGFNGTDDFKYWIGDVDGGPYASADVVITVISINDPPVPVDDFVFADEDESILLNGVGNPFGNDFDILSNDADLETPGLLELVGFTEPESGSIRAELNPAGSLFFLYFPDEDFTGLDSFTYTVSDMDPDPADVQKTAQATVSVFVFEVDDPPKAVDDVFQVDSSNILNQGAPGVIGNDTDAEGDDLTAELLSQPTQGALIFHSNGSFIYMYAPTDESTGIDSFTYRLNDGQFDSEPATVTIIANLMPIAVNDVTFTLENTPITINILVNDADANGDTLGVSSIPTLPSNGLVQINGTTITYFPNPNFIGQDSFVYQITDGRGGFASARVDVQVFATNVPPAAVNDIALTPEDTAITINVTANDSDANAGDTLAVSSFTAPLNGTIASSGAGSLTYSPNPDFNGVDTFTYRITDGLVESDAATVTITISAVNDAPVAVDDELTTDEDMPLAFAGAILLSNDTDVDGDNLAISAFSQPANGQLVDNGFGVLTYTPDLHFNGDDSFTYDVTDGRGGGATATVQITVESFNNAPVTVNDLAVIFENEAVTINVLANDSDADDDPLTISALTQPTNGQVELNGDGTITYTPQNDFFGSETFTYKVVDAELESEAATVNVIVIEISHVPVVNGDAYSTDEDTDLEIVATVNGVLQNDTDGDNDSLTALFESEPANGTLTFNSDGTFTYSPNLDSNGEDSFTYTATDGFNVSALAVVSIFVNPINDAPVAVDDFAIINQDTSAVIDLTGNDEDAENDPLAISALSQPANAAVVINNGTVTYTPAPGFIGDDTFTYFPFDGTLASASSATVTVTVRPTVHIPVALPDQYEVDEDTELMVTSITNGLLGNDSDEDAGTTLTAELVTQPSSGTMNLNGDGTFTFTPADDFSGDVTFTYRASDGGNLSNVVTVTIAVNPINDPPTAGDDNDIAVDGLAKTIFVLENDTDIDTGNNIGLVISAVTSPANGEAKIMPTGREISYKANNDFSGLDMFAYVVTDFNGGNATATVTILVFLDNVPPVANDDAETTPEDADIDIDLVANDNDVDGTIDAGTVTITQAPVNGNLQGPDPVTGVVTYSNLANFTGTDTFTYIVEDTDGAVSNEATVTVTVVGINDPPVALEDARITGQDLPINIDVITGSDADVDGDTLTITGVTQPANGSVVVVTESIVTYLPDSGFAGVDNFSYTISDGNGGTDTATVTVAVKAPASQQVVTVIIGFDKTSVIVTDSFDVLVFVQEDTVAAMGFMSGPIDLTYDPSFVGYNPANLPFDAADLMEPPYDNNQGGTLAATQITDLTGDDTSGGPTFGGDGVPVLYARISFLANDLGTALFGSVAATNGSGLTIESLLEVLPVDICYLANSIEIVPNPGDFNNDLVIDLVDFALFFPALGSSTGDPLFDDQFDFDGDGDVDFNDLTAFVALIGTTYGARGTGGVNGRETMAKVRLEGPPDPVRVGDVFQIRVFVQEDTEQAVGFRGGPFDLTFDDARVAYHGGFDTANIIQPPFNSIATNGGLQAGRVNELAGVTVQDNLGDGSPVLYAVLTYEATAVGTAAFSAAAGEIGFALSPPAGHVAVGDVAYGDVVTVDILEAGGGGGVDEGWRLAIAVNNAPVPEVFLGIGAGATDLYDSGIDWFAFPGSSPGQNNADVVFEIETTDLLRDIRGFANAAFWLLRATAAAAEDTVLSWDSSRVPEGGLLLRELAGNGNRGEGGVSLDMAEENSVTVPAGDIMLFEITFGGVAFEMILYNGWNLVSVPIQPVNAGIDALFGNSAGQQVWESDGVVYNQADVMETKKAYWVFRLGDEVTITIHGTLVEDTAMALSAGWNMVGAVADPPFNNLPTPLDVNPPGSLEPPIWIFDGEIYIPVDTLIPGFGHWIHVNQDAEIR